MYNSHDNPDIVAHIKDESIHGRSASAFPNSLLLRALSADPDDPPAGFSIIWLSDGTATGSEGELLIKYNDGVTIRTAIIAQLVVIASGDAEPDAGDSVEDTLLGTYTP
jgi:hypothetical protein